MALGWRTGTTSLSQFSSACSPQVVTFWWKWEWSDVRFYIRRLDFAFGQVILPIWFSKHFKNYLSYWWYCKWEDIQQICHWSWSQLNTPPQSCRKNVSKIDPKNQQLSSFNRDLNQPNGWIPEIWWRFGGNHFLKCILCPECPEPIGGSTKVATGSDGTECQLATSMESTSNSV